jgi:2-polyprenyl-3-methyl-5-hydroxy-6-metoxy-1,4-benzoquinol methylase
MGNRKNHESFFQEKYNRLVESPNHSPIWWHSMPLPDGNRISGQNPDKDLQFKIWRAMQIDDVGGLNGRRVLDVGANDGFFTLAATMAGATKVTAIDNGWLTWPQNIRYASDVWGATPEIVTSDFRSGLKEQYDVIFFLGVLYHLEDVFTCMGTLSGLLERQGVIYIETQMSAIESHLPLFEYASDIYPTVALQSKGNLSRVGISNYLFPNEAAIRNLAYSYDFEFEHLTGTYNVYSQENPTRQVFKFSKSS